jgi:3-hydroxymyristoyl/3-hydroxydecanoyl-(acyl carrier protein) dehydratase
LRSTVEQSLQQVRKTGNVIEAEACFSSAAPIFHGHFPGRPIVPAVYQMALCRVALERYLSGRFVQVVRSRFISACAPDVLYNAKMSIDENAGSSLANCLFRRGDVICSKIVLLYGTPAIRG